MITSHWVLMGSAAGSAMAGEFTREAIVTSIPICIGFLSAPTDARASNGIGTNRGTVLAVPQSRADR